MPALTESAILERIIVDPATQQGPAGDRKSARELHAKVIGWGLTDQERHAVKSALMQALTVGRKLEDGTYRKPGPRTLTMLAKTLAELHRQDLSDLHHLEGSTHRVESTDGRPEHLQLAEMYLQAAALTGRADLKAKAQELIARGEGQRVVEQPGVLPEPEPEPERDSGQGE